MSQQRFWPAVAILLLLPLFLVTPRSRALAQPKVAATVALVRTLPDSTATATIIREAGPGARTMILLREDNLTPAILSSALISLARSRLSYGDTVQHEMVITLHGARSTRSLSADERRTNESYIERLRSSKPVVLNGVGLARTIIVNAEPVKAVTSR